MVSDPERSVHIIGTVRKELRGALSGLRAAVSTLRMPLEAELPLDQSLSRLATRFREAGQLPVHLALATERMDFQKVTVELTHLYRYTNADWRFTIPAGAAYADELVSWECIPGDVPSDHSAQLAAVLDALERGEVPLTSGAAVRRTVEFLACLYKSALTGQPVAHGSILPGDPFYARPNGRVE